MNVPAKRYQRGAALIALLAVVMLAASWILVSRLNAASGDFTAATRMRNALVLNQAKQALIGWIAQQASKSGEPDPGRLPCPEPSGIAGSTTEGGTAGSCGAGPAIGRFPWRTLGMDRPVDAAGEPLWLVVSSGWAKASGGAFLTINSSSVGQLTVDGQANAAVALIVAPGSPKNVQASAGCAARNQQARPAPAPGINPLDYIECFNAATASFSTTGPGDSFNDQVVTITVADVMPALEAAIAHRIERDLAPKLKQVYTAANNWGLSPGVALPAGTSLFPYAATFTDPTAVPDAPNTPDRVVYTGAAGTYVGLVPLAKQMPGSVAWVNPATGFTLSLLGPGVLTATDCSGSTPTLFSCSVIFAVSSNFTLDVDASNIGTGFRQAPGLQSSLVVTGGTGTVTNSLRADGSARVRIAVTPSFPLIGTASIQLPINAADAVTDDITVTETWYFRNNWHQFTLYMVSKGLAPGSGVGTTPVGACGGGSPPCLTINDSRYPPMTRQAALILAGRALPGQSRPSSTLANFLEGENLAPLDEVLRRGAASTTINDRIVSVAP